MNWMNTSSRLVSPSLTVTPGRFERLRSEKRFASASELSSQIARDLEAARSAVARALP